jgi:hypothetical protein
VEGMGFGGLGADLGGWVGHFDRGGGTWILMAGVVLLSFKRCLLEKFVSFRTHDGVSTEKVGRKGAFFVERLQDSSRGSLSK